MFINGSYFYLVGKMNLLQVRQSFDRKFSAIAQTQHCKEGNTISSAHCLQDKNELLAVFQEKYHYPVQEEQYENVAKKNSNCLPQLYQHAAMPIQISSKSNKTQTYGKNHRSNSKYLIWQWL